MHISLDDMALVTVVQGDAANVQTTQETMQLFKERSKSEPRLPPPRPVADSAPCAPPEEIPGTTTVDDKNLAIRKARVWYPIESIGTYHTADQRLGTAMVSLLRHDMYIMKRMEADRSTPFEEFQYKALNNKTLKRRVGYNDQPLRG